mgnify:CR=1 FL=1
MLENEKQNSLAAVGYINRSSWSEWSEEKDYTEIIYTLTVVDSCWVY